MKPPLTPTEIETFADNLTANLDRLAEADNDMATLLNPEAKDKLKKYGIELIKTNRMMNLTALTEPIDVAVKHFADSLTLLPLLKNEFSKFASAHAADQYRWIDVGTGAGFPGLPVQALASIGELSLLDSLKKRLAFLNDLAGKLSVDNVRYIHARAEDAGRDKKYREHYSLAVARAVAPLPILCELCLPLVKQGGCFVAMKGPAAEVEMTEIKTEIRELGAETEAIRKFELPLTHDERCLIIFRKKQPTPAKFPRHTAKIYSK